LREEAYLIRQGLGSSEVDSEIGLYEHVVEVGIGDEVKICHLDVCENLVKMVAFPVGRCAVGNDTC
jgi:hypothetical protein